MEKFQSVSSVSGGTWGTSIYMFGATFKARRSRVATWGLGVHPKDGVGRMGWTGPPTMDLPGLQGTSNKCHASSNKCLII